MDITDDEHRELLGVLFGCRPDDVAERIVFTPIPAFYRACLHDADLLVETSGWWRLATAETADHRYTVVQHFEGNRITDAIDAVTKSGKRVAFLGLAGTLVDDIDVGQVVQIAVGHRDGATAAAPLDNAGAVAPVVDAVTSDGLLADRARIARTQRLTGAAVVDLESAYFFDAARRHAVADAVALALITDRPPTEPFWKIRFTDESMFAAGLRMRGDLFRSWSSVTDAREGEMSHG